MNDLLFREEELSELVLKKMMMWRLDGVAFIPEHFILLHSYCCSLTMQPYSHARFLDCEQCIESQRRGAMKQMKGLDLLCNEAQVEVYFVPSAWSIEIQ
jgi:hypothetical protein